MKIEEREQHGFFKEFRTTQRSFSKTRTNPLAHNNDRMHRPLQQTKFNSFTEKEKISSSFSIPHIPR
jgi:hypothetical protein